MITVVLYYVIGLLQRYTKGGDKGEQKQTTGVSAAFLVSFIIHQNNLRETGAMEDQASGFTGPAEKPFA